jgi:hypothetical protein
MRRIVISVTVILLMTSSCKKETESETKYCWNIVDASGNSIGQICDKTEQELLDCTNCGTFNGSQPGQPLRNVLTSCNYFKVIANEPTFCWKSGNFYRKNLTEKYAQCFFTGGQIIDCNISETWYTRNKNVFKLNNNTTYSPITMRNYSNIDTLNLFNYTQQIILRNTTDSIITLQRSKTGSNFY